MPRTPSRPTRSHQNPKTKNEVRKFNMEDDKEERSAVAAALAKALAQYNASLK